MKDVIVLYNKKEYFEDENVNNELYWYDNIRKELVVFNGGKLSYEYKKDDYLTSLSKEEKIKLGIKSDYRMLPKVENLTIKNYNKKQIKVNKEEVVKWFFNYINYNNTNAYISDFKDYGITVTLDDNEVGDFVYDAERHGIGCQV